LILKQTEAAGFPTAFFHDRDCVFFSMKAPKKSALWKENQETENKTPRKAGKEILSA